VGYWHREPESEGCIKRPYIDTLEEKGERLSAWEKERARENHYEAERLRGKMRKALRD